MQIVANNCLGGYIYRHYNAKFLTPFVWNAISPDDYLKLVQNIRNINFNNVNMSIDVNTKKKSKDKFVVVEMEYGIKLNFLHHNENDKFLTPTKTNAITLECKNIINKYFKETFTRRSKRMNLKDGFIFVCSDSSDFYNCDYNFLSKFIN